MIFQCCSLDVFTRGGHSDRLCTDTRDLGQERGQAVKVENLEGKMVKDTLQIRGSNTVNGQVDTTSHQSMIPYQLEQLLVKGQRTI